MIALPGIVYLLINNYIPMFGIFLAFKNYSLRKGVFGSDWCGLQNFQFLFKTKDACRTWIRPGIMVFLHRSMAGNYYHRKSLEEHGISVNCLYGKYFRY